MRDKRLLILALLVISPWAANADLIELEFEFDLDSGSQFEIGGVGSGLSIYRTANDFSQPFSIQDGDVLSITIRFANDRAIKLSNNSSAFGTGIETFQVEIIPVSPLLANTGNTVFEILGITGDSNGSIFSRNNGSAFGALIPIADGNFTDTSFSFTGLSVTHTVLSGMPSLTAFSLARLAISGGTAIEIVDAPSVSAWAAEEAQPHADAVLHPAQGSTGELSRSR